MIEIGAESRIVPAKVALCDELLAPDELRAIQEFFRQREREFETSEATFPDHGPARVLRSTAGHGSVVFRRIASHWPSILRELGMQPFGVDAAQVRMVASNDGDLVHLHGDNAQNAIRSRVLSFVYFCHCEPKAFGGGLLRIHASAWNNGTWRGLSRFRSIEPEPNRLVVFPSFLLHDVTQVECPSRRFVDGRLAMNGWFCHARAGATPNERCALRPPKSTEVAPGPPSISTSNQLCR
jgi:Rps23 Pro-64 3,4-dihydroxylase Tpa1-like proline 4-hydroxylase